MPHDRKPFSPGHENRERKIRERLLPGVADQFCRIDKGFRHTADVANDRHKVVVANPAGNNVKMQMICDPGARRDSKIESDIESVRTHQVLQQILCTDTGINDFMPCFR